MCLADLLEAMNAGESIVGDSPFHAVMQEASEEALRITDEMNGTFLGQAKVRQLLAELMGKPVHESVTVYPPFFTDFGKNITLGEGVFLNAGVRIQDQGGVTIGDHCLIGEGSVLATLNHDLNHARPADMHPAPIVLGRNVWLGSNVTVLPGSTICDDAVIPPGAVVVGSPARVVRTMGRRAS